MPYTLEGLILDEIGENKTVSKQHSNIYAPEVKDGATEKEIADASKAAKDKFIDISSTILGAAIPEREKDTFVSLYGDVQNPQGAALRNMYHGRLKTAAQSVINDEAKLKDAGKKRHDYRLKDYADAADALQETYAELSDQQKAVYLDNLLQMDEFETKPKIARMLMEMEKRGHKPEGISDTLLSFLLNARAKKETGDISKYETAIKDRVNAYFAHFSQEQRDDLIKGLTNERGPLPIYLVLLDILEGSFMKSVNSKYNDAQKTDVGKAVVLKYVSDVYGIAPQAPAPAEPAPNQAPAPQPAAPAQEAPPAETPAAPAPAPEQPAPAPAEAPAEQTPPAEQPAPAANGREGEPEGQPALEPAAPTPAPVGEAPPGEPAENPAPEPVAPPVQPAAHAPQIPGEQAQAAVDQALQGFQERQAHFPPPVMGPPSGATVVPAGPGGMTDHPAIPADLMNGAPAERPSDEIIRSQVEAECRARGITDPAQIDQVFRMTRAAVGEAYRTR